MSSKVNIKYPTMLCQPIAQKVIAAVESARGSVVKLPTMDDGVPLKVIEQALGTHTVMVPIANYDNNQRSANENIRLRNLWTVSKPWQRSKRWNRSLPTSFPHNLL